MAHRPVHSPVPRYARTGYPGRPRFWAEEGVGRVCRRARVLKGMDSKPIVISRAGSCPADDAI